MDPENKKPSNPSIQTCTLRDMFANTALQGIIDDKKLNEKYYQDWEYGYGESKVSEYIDKTASNAYKIADAMLKQREQ